MCNSNASSSVLGIKYYKCRLVKIDIKGACLRTPIVQGETTCPYIIIRINKDLVPFWIKQDSEAEQYGSETGDRCIQLNKYL